MPANSPVTATRKPEARSAVSNGRKLFFPGADGRSATARRFRDLYAALCDDLGGIDALTEMQKSLARRAASLSVSCEQCEADQISGRPFARLEYSQMAGSLARILARLGLERSLAHQAAGMPSTGKLSDEDLAKLSTQELVSLYRSIT